jgi:hypothetical protein
MSLINDALKRAKQTRQGNPKSAAPVPPPPPLYRPLETAPRRARTSPLSTGAVILLIAAGIFCVGLALFKHPAAKTAATASTSGGATTATTSTSAAKSSPESSTADETSASPPYPLPKVQGIVFSPAKPWAIVNGKTVFIGDSIGNLRVKKILRNSVVVVGGGRTNQLFIGE